MRQFHGRDYGRIAGLQCEYGLSDDHIIKLAEKAGKPFTPSEWKEFRRVRNSLVRFTVVRSNNPSTLFVDVVM